MGRGNGNPEGKGWLYFRIIFYMAILIAYAGMFAYTYYVNNTDFMSTKSENTSNCEMRVVVSKEWDETAHGYAHGMQYDITVKNYMKHNLTDWVAELQMIDGCYMDSSWSGVFEFENNKITITPMDYNQVIGPNDEITFGFVLYAPSMNNIEEYQVIFRKNMRLIDLELFWLLSMLTGIAVVVEITLLLMGFKTRSLWKKQAEYLNIINQSFLTFSNMIDAKDTYTTGHSQRVAVYSREIARRMGLSKDEQQNLFYIALLHDIGKIGIHDSILKKDGKLDSEEREVVEQHVLIGGDILKDFNAIPGIEAGARYHHERYDGKGYGSGLKEKEIPLYGRIICVADAFDAMSSARCYRPKLPMDVIIEELRTCSGTQFDPEIVPYMLQMIEEKVVPIDSTPEALHEELKTSDTAYNLNF